jgi:hypothetical protein
MKSLATVILSSMFLVSCSHFHETLATDKEHVLEVRLADAKHEPKVGDRVTAFNWICQIIGKGSRSQRWSCNRENEVSGKISEVISNERIKVMLEKEFKVIKETYVDLD